MKTTKNAAVAPVIIESVADSYVKIVCNGKTLARADLVISGKWRLHVLGNDWAEAKMVEKDLVAPWIAMQTLLVQLKARA